MGTGNTGECNDLRAVCFAADAILAQCAEYIDRVEDDQFVQESKVVPGGTIGKHIRHPASLVPAALAATLAFWLAFGRSGSLTQQPLVLALGLWCAFGSALIYRHFLIRFRDESDLLD